MANCLANGDSTLSDIPDYSADREGIVITLVFEVIPMLVKFLGLGTVLLVLLWAILFGGERLIDKIRRV